MVMLFVNISISIILIPRWGSLGAAIGTSISYLVIQGLYVFNQHNHLGISSLKIKIIFVIILFVGAIQIVIGGLIIIRLIFSIMVMLATIIVAKNWKICDDEVVASFLPAKLSWVGRILI